MQLKPKEILGKYDEEIEGKRKEKFELGKRMFKKNNIEILYNTRMHEKCKVSRNTISTQ